VTAFPGQPRSIWSLISRIREIPPRATLAGVVYVTWPDGRSVQFDDPYVPVRAAFFSSHECPCLDPAAAFLAS